MPPGPFGSFLFAFENDCISSGTRLPRRGGESDIARLFGDRFRRITFRKRIIFIFLISSLIPFVCIAVLSFYTINTILNNQVENSLKNILQQDLLVLENTLNNLNHVSQQVAFSNGINELVEQLQSERDPYERSSLISRIKSELNVISFSNPNIGLMMYYSPESGTYEFENFRVRDDFAVERLPILEKYPDITYYGPYRSYNSYVNRYVFSTMRKINLPDSDIYLFVETGADPLKLLLDSENPRRNHQLLVLDSHGRIAFSENEADFPGDGLFPAYHSGQTSGYYHDYFWNMAQSNQGWSLVSIVPQRQLNSEKDKWLRQMIGFFFLLMVYVIFISWLVWKMVYNPLDKFNREIKSLVQSGVKKDEYLTYIPEFDFLLLQIRRLKKQIWEMLHDIRKEEKRRADLEVEKLLYQINPHFLMNTLDTVHWLAVMNGQTEIDKLVLSLNRLLHYNLGKKEGMSDIKSEIEALNEYLQLQQIRYDFKFDVTIDVDDDTMQLAIPRFILQPLVENSLYHGIDDDGYIHVDIRMAGDGYLVITIRDNGAGMSKETIERLLQDETLESQKIGMGIGMRYVKRILKAQYGERAIMAVDSEEGKGTVVRLKIPFHQGSKPYDSRIDRG